MNLQKKQSARTKDSNKILITASFVYALITFLILIAVGVVYLLSGGFNSNLEIIKVNNDIVSILGYVLIGVTYVACCVTAMMNIAFLVEEKEKPSTFLIITTVFNIILPIILVVAFVLFVLNPNGPNVDAFYILFFPVTFCLVIIFALIQIISNGISFGQYGNNPVAKSKPATKKAKVKAKVSKKS